MSGLVEAKLGEKVSAPKLWRRLRDEAADLQQMLAAGSASALAEMLTYLSRYVLPGRRQKYPSTRQRLKKAAEAAQVIRLTRPLEYLRACGRSLAERSRNFQERLEKSFVAMKSSCLAPGGTASA
jgi:hypothetical protein